MLRVAISVLIFFCFSAQAANFGKSLSPKVDASGKASFGIQYAYDIDLVWSLLFTSSLTHIEISQLPPTLYWTVIDVKSGVPYQAWSEMNGSDLVVGTYGIEDASALFKFLPKMKDAIIVISPDKTTALYSINLKNLCETYPNSILDMSNTMNPKCTIDPSQLPDIEGECKEEQELLQDWLGRGMITCAIANKQLARMGCAPLNCQ